MGFERYNRTKAWLKENAMSLYLRSETRKDESMDQFKLPEIKVDPTMKEEEWKMEQTSSPQQEEQLKPCPLCGKEPVEYGGIDPYVCCLDCQCENETDKWQHSWANTRIAELELLAGKMASTLDKVETKQTEIISMLRKNGFVFENKGGRWEKLAFTLYSEICDLRSQAKDALESWREFKEKK